MPIASYRLMLLHIGIVQLILCINSEVCTFQRVLVYFELCNLSDAKRLKQIDIPVRWRQHYLP